METFLDFFTNGASLLVVAGGLGWLLGVTCILLRYNEVKTPAAHRVILLNDVISKTFVTITFVGVLVLSVQLAVHLPISHRLVDGQEGIESTIQSLRAEIPPETDLSGLVEGQGGIEAAIRELRADIPPRTDLSSLIDGQENIEGAISGLRLGCPDLMPILARTIQRLEGGTGFGQDEWGGVRCAFASIMDNEYIAIRYGPSQNNYGLHCTWADAEWNCHMADW